MMTHTSLGPALDLPRAYQENPQPQGVRKNGVYEVPGQHLYDGMYFGNLVLPEELDRIKDSLDFNQGDVISSGYPKAGNLGYS